MMLSMQLDFWQRDEREPGLWFANWQFVNHYARSGSLMSDNGAGSDAP